MNCNYPQNALSGKEYFRFRGRSIYGVAFDLDGVLTETSRSHYLAWRDLAEQLGFNLPEVYEDHLRGISRFDSLKLVLKASGTLGTYTDEELTELATWKNYRYLEYIKAYSPKDLLPGAEALLQALKKSGILIALASASANAIQLLNAMEIAHYFDWVVDARQVVNGKPHPEIFLSAAKGLNLDPAQMLGVEDAVAGIESIKAAGMIAIGISPSGSLSGSEITYTSLEALNQSIIRNLDA